MNRRKPSTPAPTQATERIVSILPSDLVHPERDIAAGLAGYVSAARREDGMKLSGLPVRCEIAVDLMRKRPRTSFGQSVEFLLDWGSAALLSRPEIKRIREAHAIVLPSDDQEALKRFKWAYHLVTDQRGVTDRFARVAESTQDRVNVLSAVLGVDKRVVVAIALESMLMEAACLPDSLKRQMADEVRTFLGVLRRRADELEQVARDAAPPVVTSIRFSMDEM
jgi:hypothetical protein